MVQEMNLYSDSECTTFVDTDTTDIINAVNANIAEKTCNADDGNSFKERVYCDSPSSYVAMHYNAWNEDPNCLRSYPSYAVIYPPLSFSDGQCVAWGTNGRLWIKIKIVANENSKFFLEDISVKISSGIVASILALIAVTSF